MCLFCGRRDNVLFENETCFAIMDEYPVNYGHMLIIPKEHRETFFDLTYKEHEDMMMLARNCRQYIDKQLQPDGYNVGFNVGAWAGQSVNHCHMHLIPRFAGDVPATELKGGIRNIKKPIKEYR